MATSDVPVFLGKRSQLERVVYNDLMGKKKNQSVGDAVAVGTAIAGAALGAAAIYLSNKKNQEKIKKTIDEVSDEAVKIGRTVKKKVEEFAGSKEKVKKTPKSSKTAKNKPTASAKKKVYTPLKKS